MSKLNSVNIFSCLTYFLPVAIVTGSFLTDLIVCLIAIYFFYKLVKEKLWFYFKNYFSYIFLCFYFYILIRSFFSIEIILSLEHSLFYFRYLFFVFGVCYLIKKNTNFILYFFYSLSLVFLVLIVDAYIQFFFEKNIIGMTNNIKGRLSGLFYDKYILGQYLARLYPILLGLVFFVRKENKLFISVVVSLLFFIDVLVFISGDRTAFILMIMSTVMIILIANEYKVLRLIIFSFSLVFISLTLFFSETVYDRVISETIQEAQLDSEEILIISSTHQDLYMTSTKMFLDSKYFGHGPKTFRILCSNYYETSEGCSTHPHNIYLQLLSETGLLGTIPILIGFLFVSFLLFKQFLSIILKSNSNFLEDYQIFLLIAIFITLWPLAPSSSFFSNHFTPIYYLPIPFLLFNHIKNKNLANPK